MNDVTRRDDDARWLAILANPEVALPALSIAAVGFAILHALAPRLGVDWVTAALLGTAMIPFLLPWLRKWGKVGVAFPGGSVSLEDLDSVQREIEGAPPDKASLGVRELQNRLHGTAPAERAAALKAELEHRLRALASAHGIDSAFQPFSHLIALLVHDRVLTGAEGTAIERLNELLRRLAQSAAADSSVLGAIQQLVATTVTLLDGRQPQALQQKLPDEALEELKNISRDLERSVVMPDAANAMVDDGLLERSLAANLAMASATQDIEGMGAALALVAAAMAASKADLDAVGLVDTEAKAERIRATLGHVANSLMTFAGDIDARREKFLGNMTLSLAAASQAAKAAATMGPQATESIEKNLAAVIGFRRVFQPGRENTSKFLHVLNGLPALTADFNTARGLAGEALKLLIEDFRRIDESLDATIQSMTDAAARSRGT